MVPSIIRISYDNSNSDASVGVDKIIVTNLNKNNMNFFEKIRLDLSIFKKDLLEAAATSASITKKIDAALTSQTALVVESLIPNGAAWGAEAKLLIDVANGSLQAVVALKDPEAAKGILQRLGSKLTELIHGGKHPLSDYIMAFEYIFGLTA